MKKLLILISFIVSFVFSFGQAIIPRSNGSLTVQDSNWFGGNSFRVPVFNDTTQANVRRPSLDSAGKVIFTRDLNWFWGRQTTPTRKWIPFNNSTNGLTTSCGTAGGTNIITWDSLLTFDLMGGPYILCCDGVPRMTTNTTITLDSNDADFPRIDLIILDSNGVNSIKGTPAVNPSTPQTDSCQIILTYVLIHAHDTVPAIITPTNPLVIYDENFYFNDSTEFVLDTSANFGSVDTADLSNPVHLLHDLKITNPSSANAFKFQSIATFDLNDYGALKFYFQKSQAAAVTLLITFFLDSVQQTLPISVVSANGGANTYATFIIPIANVRYIGTSQFNQVRFQFGAPQTGTFYFDWIQLQMGFPIINTTVGTGTVSSVGATNLNPIFNTTITNANTTPVLHFSQQNADPYSVLGNTASTAGAYSWTKVNLGTMVDSLLGVQFLSGGNSGDVLKNINNVWTPVPDVPDTVFTNNWISVNSGDNWDTLQFGSSQIDSSLLNRGTYAGLNGNFFRINNVNAQDWFLLDPTTFTVRLATQSDDNSKHTSFFGISAGNIDFDINSTNGSDVAEIIGDALNKRISLAADSILLTSTLSGKLTGYVWTLKDPTTGSGYWSPRAGVDSTETLQEVFNTEVGGSVLTKLDSIEAGTFGLQIIGNNASFGLLTIADDGIVDGNIVSISTSNNGPSASFQNALSVSTDGVNVNSDQTSTGITVSNTHSGTNAGNIGINVNVSGGANINTFGLRSNVENGTAIYAVSSNFFGADIESTNSTPLYVASNNADNSGNIQIARFIRNTSTTASNNLSGYFSLETENSSGTNIQASMLKWKLTNVTPGSETGQFTISTWANNTINERLIVNSDGSLQISPITATAASAITPAEGMMLFVSSTNGTFLSVGFWGYQGGLWIKM